MTPEWDIAPGFIHTEAILWDSSWPELADDSERKTLFSYLEDRFGIPQSTFNGYLLFKRSDSWSILRSAAGLKDLTHLKVSRVGLKAFQKVGRYIKPTTRLIQFFGHLATRSVVEISKEQMQGILTDNGLSVELPLEKGYVILKLAEHMILGLGFFAQGRVRSQLPKKERLSI